jgi:hypothetical protein
MEFGLTFLINGLNFEVGTAASETGPVKLTNGPPTDAAFFNSAPAVGTLAVDSTTGQLYARFSGTNAWRNVWGTFPSTAVNPKISQSTTATGNGQTLTVNAQDTTDPAGTGGGLFLGAGSGAVADGAVTLGVDTNFGARFTFPFHPSAGAANLNWGNTFTAVSYTVGVNTTDNATGVATTYAGQNCSGANATGGSATLQSGSGTLASGSCFIAPGGNKYWQFLSTGALSLLNTATPTWTHSALSANGNGTRFTIQAQNAFSGASVASNGAGVGIFTGQGFDGGTDGTITFGTNGNFGMGLTVPVSGSGNLNWQGSYSAVTYTVGANSGTGATGISTTFQGQNCTGTGATTGGNVLVASGTGATTGSVVIKCGNTVVLQCVNGTETQITTFVELVNVSQPAQPTGASRLFANAGALKAIGSSGTVTTMAPAEPHCPECGSDFGVEYEHADHGYLAICLTCLVEEIGERNWIRKRGRAGSKPR